MASSTWHERFDRLRRNQLVFCEKKVSGEDVEESFEDNLVAELEYAIELIETNDDSMPAFLTVEYLVHDTMWDIFETIPQYLDQHLRGKLSTNKQCPTLLRKLLTLLGQHLNYREIYTLVMSEVVKYRNSPLLVDFLGMIRSSLGRVDFLKRDSFIIDATATLVSCFRCRVTDKYDGIPTEMKYVTPLMGTGILGSDPPSRNPGDIDFMKLAESEGLKVETIPNKREDEEFDIEMEMGSKEWVARALFLTSCGVDFLSGSRDNPSPFSMRVLTKSRKAISSIILTILEPWLVCTPEILSQQEITEMLQSLLVILQADGWNMHDLLVYGESFMPWASGDTRREEMKCRNDDDPFHNRPREQSMEIDEEEEDDEKEIVLSSDGGSMIAYLMTVTELGQTSMYFPQVYSPVWSFSLFIPYTRGMLLSPSLSVGLKGIELASWLIARTPEKSISCPGLKVSKELSATFSGDQAYLALAEALIAFACSVQAESVQRASWALTKKFLTTFKADDSFFITRLLIDGCPYSHVVGLLLDIVLTNTQASFTSHQPDGGGQSIYLSSAPSELAWKVIDGLKDSDLCDAAETYSSALSLFRYLLIRDAKTNYCELWPGIVTRKLEVLNQLHAETKTRIGTRTGDAGAALSAKSQQSLQMEVLRLNLLLDILDRILELVTNDASSLVSHAAVHLGKVVTLALAQHTQHAVVFSKQKRTPLLLVCAASNALINSSLQDFQQPEMLSGTDQPLFPPWSAVCLNEGNEVNSTTKRKAFHLRDVVGVDRKKKKIREAPPPEESTSKRATFILKLWDMLNSEVSKPAVDWVDDGTAFAVLDRDKFVDEILPAFFNHNNIASFERQMNFYSFAKMGIEESVTTGRRFRHGASVKFKHTYFRQNEKESLGLIVRKTCPLNNKNMESELVDLRVEIDGLKAERKDLEMKLSFLKKSKETGIVDKLSKDLIENARKVWHKVAESDPTSKMKFNINFEHDLATEPTVCFDTYLSDETCPFSSDDDEIFQGTNFFTPEKDCLFDEDLVPTKTNTFMKRRSSMKLLPSLCLKTPSHCPSPIEGLAMDGRLFEFEAIAGDQLDISALVHSWEQEVD